MSGNRTLSLYVLTYKFEPSYAIYYTIELAVGDPKEGTVIERFLPTDLRDKMTGTFGPINLFGERR